MTHRERIPVRLHNATLDEKHGEIVAHGYLDGDSIQPDRLHVDFYQREIIEARYGHRSPLLKAVEKGPFRFPDVVLGMRGEHFATAKNGKGESFNLQDPVFIIDGLQRISALRTFHADHPESEKVWIGAEVRFNTTPEMERELFTILNTKRKMMSPNVIIRNEKVSNDGIATLYGLSTNDATFPLWQKVCWNQQMGRGELITALTLLKTSLYMHSYGISGFRNNREYLVEALTKVIKNIGLQNFRRNLQTFFGAVDEVWGIRGVKYQDRAVHLKGNFLFELAHMIDHYEDFWQGHKLVITADQKRKLRTFPMNDPTVIRLSGAGQTAGALLQRHLIDHMNKNKQIKYHLKPRVEK